MKRLALFICAAIALLSGSVQAAALPGGGNPIGGFDYSTGTYHWYDVDANGFLGVNVENTVVTTGGTSTTTSNNGGTATSSPPTYVNGTTDPLSLTLNGLLRVDGSNVTQPVSQVATTGSFNNTLQNAQTGSANGSSLDVHGYGSVVFLVTGTMGTATVNFEVSADATASLWEPLTVVPMTAGATPTTTTTSTGIYQASVSGFYLVRARTSGASGTNLNVSANVVPISSNSGVPISGSVSGSGNFTVVQPTASSLNATVTVSGTPTVTIAPTTTGGSSVAKILSAASTNATNVKASAGKLFLYTFTNSNTSWRYVHFYDSSSAPTAGSGTTLWVVGVPPGGCVSGGDLNGIQFANGIGYTITAGAADTDATAVGANEITGQFSYK